jgi:hypothetical protein
MNDEDLKLVAYIMTSGTKQEGANFTLPESMMGELIKTVRYKEHAKCIIRIEDYIEHMDKQWKDFGYEIIDVLRNMK